MLMQDALDKISTNKNLRGTELRVMITMWAEMEYGGIVTVSQRYLANKLEVPRPSVSLAINRLVEAGILTKIVFKDRPAYQFNKDIVSRGKPARQP